MEPHCVQLPQLTTCFSSASPHPAASADPSSPHSRGRNAPPTARAPASGGRPDQVNPPPLRRARWVPFSPLCIATAVNPTLIYSFFNKRLLCSFLGPKMQGDRSCLAQHDTPRFSILLTIQYAPQSFSE